MGTIADNPQMKASATSRIAPEIWRQVATYLISDENDDNILVNTWLDVRPVSKQLQAAVEEIYAKKLLPQIEIEFKIDSRFDYLGGSLERKLYTENGILRGSTMHLDRLGPLCCQSKGGGVDDTHAVFKTDNFCIEVPYKSSKEELKHESGALEEQWRADMHLYLGDGGDNGARFELTPHIVKLRNIINDTELPGLQIDYEKREVSFDWRLMLSKLFNEERFVTRSLRRATVSDSAAKVGSEAGGIGFMDLLEYQRMAWAMDNSYCGSSAPCQKCAAKGEVEFKSTFVFLKGQEFACTPKTLLQPSTDQDWPPHDDSQLLRCPIVWRLYRDLFTKLSTIRQDFPPGVVRHHWARRQAREHRINYWYQHHDRKRGAYEDDWVSQARILQRLRLVRLLWREENRNASHDYDAEEEQLSWYSQPHTLPYHEVKGGRDLVDESILPLLDSPSPDYGCRYGIAYDYEDDACVVM